MDRTNTNAQNANARALLSRFRGAQACWTALASDGPADSILQNKVQIRTITRSRFWNLHLALRYQERFDAVFYPGPHWGDYAGLELRSLRGKPAPVIATMEGIIASPDDVQKISGLVGHPVSSQPGTDAAIPRIRALYQRADHIIALSPFLARVGKLLYGDKLSSLPLGLETRIFHPEGRQEPARCRVVGCGTVKASKNISAFLRAAAQYKDADFVWFGSGEGLPSFIAEAQQKNLANLHFPGPVPPDTLADEFRRSSIFVLPSHSEGVPKVTQEAAACGLPVVVMGFFEAPSVIQNQNGLVAFSDDELLEHVGTLLRNPPLRSQMGAEGAQMAKAWDWDRIAPQWEAQILSSLGR